MATKYAFIAMVALGIAGCASIPKGDPDMDLALRQVPHRAGCRKRGTSTRDEWMGAVFFTNVAVDGEPLGQVGSRTYLHTEVPLRQAQGHVSGGEHRSDRIRRRWREDLLHLAREEMELADPRDQIARHVGGRRTERRSARQFQGCEPSYRGSKAALNSPPLQGPPRWRYSRCSSFMQFQGWAPRRSSLERIDAPETSVSWHRADVYRAVVFWRAHRVDVLDGLSSPIGRVR